MRGNRARLIALVGFVRVAHGQDASFFTLPPPPPSAASNNPKAAPDPPLAPEPDAPPFGARGQIVLSNETDLTISYTRFESTAEFFDFDVVPAVDWFVTRNVSIGLTSAVYVSRSRGFGAASNIILTTSTNASVGPRVSWNLPLGRLFSFNPRFSAGIQFYHSESRAEGGGPVGLPNAVDGTSPTTVGPWISIYAPVLVHPTQHFFLGLGPSAYHAFGRVTGATDQGAERTTIGVHGTVGAHFGGQPAPSSDPEVVTQRRRFGDHHDLVISGSNNLGVSWTGYTGTRSTYTSFGFTPSADLFIGHRVALGVTVGMSYSTARGIDPVTKLEVTSETIGFGVGPRIAYDIPLAPSFSLYPRARMIFGYDKHDVRSGTNRNAYGQATITTGLFVPLLFHFAPHAFFGVGPDVSYDVLSNDDYGRKNPGIRVGGGTIIGGWI